jgi:hypothetical protein
MEILQTVSINSKKVAKFLRKKSTFMESSSKKVVSLNLRTPGFYFTIKKDLRK